MAMNSREKRTLIHQKLEIMKKCYIERNTENFDLFFDTFFDRNKLPIIIGTDNGRWFRSMGRIRWLINYDWEKWGNLIVDTWNFSIHETKNYDMVRARGILDFNDDRAWDIDILMVFNKEEGGYICRLMQFKIPRNEIRPVVILNESKEEQNKSEEEMKDLMSLNGNVSADLMRDHLSGSVKSLLGKQKPYLEIINMRKELIYIEESGDEYLFAMTGFCLHRELNVLTPFRIVGIGQGYGILDAEFSHPFVSELG